ncbi:hypothetical protein UFOVP1290_195 [uncultured Caudovirales phage]|uniref:Uncharacterized protein n=1 Tax=uncultured Caudovirales phage TaxID=2100421 RepID=A0A6J5RWP2_9CAUD|nr:hypothetical protein UFOVP1290_195 [uncultured Caudovirales phage]
MVKCSRCDGEGFVEFEEDGRYYRDVCYHCGTTGSVDDEVDLSDRLSYIAVDMATKYVAEMKRNRDQNGPEDWAFCAAENMLTEAEYTNGHIMDQSHIMREELSKLSEAARYALVDLIDGLNKRHIPMGPDTIPVRVECLPSYNVEAPMCAELEFDNDSDIPF